MHHLLATNLADVNFNRRPGPPRTRPARPVAVRRWLRRDARRGDLDPISRGRGLTAVLLFAAIARAQLPPHAVTLNPTAFLQAPAIVRTGDTVHAFGWSGHSGPGFLHYARSVDRGRTWPIRELSLAPCDWIGACAIDGDHVYALSLAQSLGLRLVSSHDGGMTWSPPVRVSLQTLASTVVSLETLVHVDGTTVNVVWPDARIGGRVWANRSLDGGVTWQANDTRLDAGITSTVASNDTQLRLVDDGAAIHVFWTSYGTQARTAHQASFDGGATWLPAAQIVTNAQLLHAAGTPAVLLVADLAGAILRSTDHGATWTPMSWPLGGRLRAFAVDGQDVLAVGLTGAGPTGMLELDHSADGGLTWLPAPYTIVAVRPLGARAFVAGGASFVHFKFIDSYLPESLVIQSDDRGITWRSVTDAAYLGLWPTADGCLVLTQPTWYLNLVQAWVLEGHTALGQGAAGTGGIVPRLAGAGLAGLGRTFALDVDAARGGSLGAWFLTFGATANVPLGGATSYLQQPVGPFGFIASAAGTASLPVVVPTSASFAGMRLVSQAFVLDPGAAAGFAATRAIETWIR